MTTATEHAATLLAQNRLRGERLPGFPETCRPASEDAAYAVQFALREQLIRGGGGDLAGYKIGATSQVMQDYLDIHNPCGGGVLANGVHRSPAEVAHAGYVHPGVECEIAVRLDADLPAGAAPLSQAQVAEAVGACMAAIEIVDDRYADWRSLDTPTLIADDFFQAGIVLGAADADWRRLDLAALPGMMAINGEERGRGRGGDVLGHPLTALAWLANQLAVYGIGLRRGQVVLTGSVVATQWVERGDRVRVDVEGLGAAEVVFA